MYQYVSFVFIYHFYTFFLRLYFSYAHMFIYLDMNISYLNIEFIYVFYLFTHSFMHWFDSIIHSMTHPLAHSLTHVHALIHSLTHSITNASNILVFQDIDAKLPGAPNFCFQHPPRSVNGALRR